MNFLEKLEELPRLCKSLILLVNDLFLIPFSLYLSCYLITGSYGLSNRIPWMVYLSLPIVTSVIFLKLGMYRAIVRYLGLKTIWTVVGAASVATIWLVISTKLFYAGAVPLRVYAIFWLLSILCLGGSRFFARQIFSSLATGRLRETKPCNKKRIAIYGAGATGVRLARYISSTSEFIHVLYFDEDKKLFGREIDGVEVFSSAELKRLCKEHAVDEVYLAIPNTDQNKRKKILEKLLDCGVRVKTVPGFARIVSGESRVEELREISVDDILGRDTVLPRKELLSGCIQGKTVLVTGAGGSIGSELCRQIVVLGPKKLILFELSEFALYKVESELKSMMIKEYSVEIEIIALLGSVQQKKRLLQVMRAYDVQTVYHAAAYKHVPIVEHNPIEGVRNNIFGTLNTVVAANETEVETFVLVSTDKAVRPTNIMGATKRFAELVLQGISQSETKTKFCMVRFGNVLNSSGSVVPLFARQIENKEAITVTHPEVTRYFMTIPEASQLVMQAGFIAKGGDVCVLDMGEPIKIIDLARKMIALSGYKEKTASSDGDIEIKIVGLRPGEKLYEELLIGDNVTGTEHPLIMRAEETSIPWDELQKIIGELDKCCHDINVKGVRDILLAVISGYDPECDIQDKVWLENNIRIKKQQKIIPFGSSS
ncbi:MAG: polysaccharide biosynthesis protein [Gammaproteobacteria bacterium]|nr:MAG: polysaccharide biosynthesis protein [Gammaproteobacteria bacterium]